MTELGRRRWFYFKVLFIAHVIWFVTFELVAWAASFLPAHDLVTDLDRWIPLTPVFVWPYEFCYVVPFLSIFICRDFHRINRAIIAIAIATFAAYVVYVVFPVGLPRVPLGDSLAERVLSIEYAADFPPGVNNMPSLHVAFVWIITLALLRERRPVVDVALTVVASLITVSTLMVKQHLVIDVVTGGLWAVGAWQIAGRVCGRNRCSGDAPEDALRRLGARIWRSKRIRGST